VTVSGEKCQAPHGLVFPQKGQEALEGDATRADADHVRGTEALRVTSVHHGDESFLTARDGLAHGYGRGRAGGVITGVEQRCAGSDRGREQEAPLHA
jgi:hypothetical protein